MPKASEKKSIAKKSTKPKKSKKDVEVEEDNLSVGNEDSDLDNVDDMPVLEEVSSALKEKYEYKPIQETVTIYVHPEDRITSEIMTKFEFAEIKSISAKQIEDGRQPFTEIGDMSDPIEIATKEIYDKQCPLSIVRARTSDGITTIAELWQVNEMGVPYD
jgi:DNA-directed RNA polymerase subunit K/omega